MNITDILGRLKKVSGSGGQFKACCPAHSDNDPSLSITQEGDRILLHCHTGCNTEDVVTAMGLTIKDLFCDGNRVQSTQNQPPQRKIVAVYDYKDLSGSVIHQTVRFEPKGFSQRRPDPEKPGGFVWNLKGITPILYNLPSVVTAVKEKQSIFIVEGEKDCDTLGNLGYTATTCPLGAGKWRSEYSEILENASIYIIPDNDASGKSHSEFIAKSLVGKAASVKMIDLSQCH